MKENKDTKAELLSENDPKSSEQEKHNSKTPLFSANEKQGWYHLLFNNISDAVIVNEWHEKKNIPGKFIEVNDAACKQLGYTRDEILQMIPSDIDNNVEDINNKPLIPTFIKNKRAIWEGLLVRKDGRKIPIETHNRLFKKDGKQFVVSTIRDISDRKRAEEALRKSEEKYHDLFENANDAIYLSDADGNMTDINHKSLELLGYSRDKLIGMSVYDHISKEHLPQFKEMVEKFKQKGWHDNFLVNALAKNGQPLVLEISSSAIMEEGKYIGARTIARDITDRILAEKALRESESRYRNLVENLPNIIYSYSDKKGIIFYSSLFEDILGYPVRQFLKHQFTWKEYIHPEDHYIISYTLKNFLEGIPYNIEYRIKDKKGAWHWFEDKSISIRKENNEVIVNGLATDITERKMMEQEIREMSIRDQLTDLYNRRGFITLADQQLKSAKRAKKRMTLLFLDSDGLKSINDTLGHKEGDKALCDTADILRQTFRESDIIARIGGDEFAVLAVDFTDMQSKPITQRLQQNINDFNLKKLRQYYLSLSWGAAIYDPDSTLSLDKLMSIADELMYVQKKAKQSISSHNMLT